MNFITVIRDNQIIHNYETGNKDAIITSKCAIYDTAVPDNSIMILHFHSSVLTCRGAEHAVLVPEHATEPQPEDSGSEVPPDGAPLV